MKLWPLGGLVSGLLLLSCGTQMAISGLLASKAQQQINGWLGAAKQPAFSDWSRAHEAAQQAVDWYPVASGEYLDRLGRIERWKHVRRVQGVSYRADLAALTDYRAAITVRPQWPFSWIGLAETKVALQQFDQELDLALNRAFELGPWRIGVNRELARIGFGAWPHLTPLQQHLTLRSASRAVAFSSREAQRTVVFAQQRGLLQALCAHLEEVEGMKRPAACAVAALTRVSDSELHSSVSLRTVNIA